MSHFNRPKCGLAVDALVGGFKPSSGEDHNRCEHGNFQRRPELMCEAESHKPQSKQLRQTCLEGTSSGDSCQ